MGRFICSSTTYKKVKTVQKAEVCRKRFGIQPNQARFCTAKILHIVSDLSECSLVQKVGKLVAHLTLYKRNCLLSQISICQVEDKPVPQEAT